MNALSWTRWTALLAFVFSLTSTVQSEFIQPVAVQANNGEGTQDALIDGLAFDDTAVGSPTSKHDRAGGMWSAIGSIKADAIFDLGKTVDLTNIYIWNYNVVSATDVGM